MAREYRLVASDHVGLVRRVIHQCHYSSPGTRGTLDLEDLEQAGMLGVMRALQDYDPERGTFSTYAWQWVRQYVRRELDNHACTVRVPVHLQAERRKRKEKMTPAMRSLDAPLPDGMTTLHDVLGSAPATREHDFESLLEQAGSRLSDRDRRILRGRYLHDYTLEQLGAELDVSRERIRQLEAKALAQLRRALRRDLAA